MLSLLLLVAMPPRVPLTPSIPVPMADPAATIELRSGWELIVDCADPCIVRSFPKANLEVSEVVLAAGERHTFTGQFIDADGTFKDKTFKGPLRVYRIRPVVDGECFLMVLPVGGGAGDLIERRVDCKLGAKPPPPEPLPAPKQAKRLAVVVVEDTERRTPEQGKTLNSLELRAWLKDGKHEIDVLSHKDRAVKANGYEPLIARIGLPAVLVFDADVKGPQKPLAELKLPADLLPELKRLVNP